MAVAETIDGASKEKLLLSMRLERKQRATMRAKKFHEEPTRKIGTSPQAGFRPRIRWHTQQRVDEQERTIAQAQTKCKSAKKDSQVTEASVSDNPFTPAIEQPVPSENEAVETVVPRPSASTLETAIQRRHEAQLDAVRQERRRRARYQAMRKRGARALMHAGDTCGSGNSRRRSAEWSSLALDEETSALLQAHVASSHAHGGHTDSSKGGSFIQCVQPQLGPFSSSTNGAAIRAQKIESIPGFKEAAVVSACMLQFTLLICSFVFNHTVDSPVNFTVVANGVVVLGISFARACLQNNTCAYSCTLKRL